MNKPYIPGVRFEADEREALLSVLRHHLSDPRQVELLITPLQRAYGRLLLGDDMTMEEIRRGLPRGWYISPTGRKLKSRPDHEVPITPKYYDNARRMALLARGFAVSARAFATVALVASLLCGTASAQSDLPMLQQLNREADDMRLQSDLSDMRFQMDRQQMQLDWQRQQEATRPMYNPATRY